MSTLFSPEQRQETLDRLLKALQTDERIGAVVIVGPGAADFRDDRSGIDLMLVLTDQEDLEPALSDWKDRVSKLLPVSETFKTTYENGVRYSVLLENYLEVVFGFIALDKLVRLNKAWRVAFDRDGRLKATVEKKRNQNEKGDKKQVYQSLVDASWQHITDAVKALERNEIWRTLYELEQLRRVTMRLAGLRYGLQTDQFQQVDQLPEMFLIQMQRTLVSSTDPTDLKLALRAIMAALFHQARALDIALEVALAPGLEKRMHDYLQAHQ